MKITFAIKSLCTTRGGAERVLVDVTSAFIGKGHDISVLTFDAPEAEPVYAFHDKLAKKFTGIGKPDQSTTFVEAVGRIFTLRKTIKADRPDVVVAFMHSMFVPLSFALIGTGIPVIASEHIVPEHYRTRKIEFLLLCLSAFFVKKITVLSEDVKHTYPKFLQNKMVAVTNPVQQAKAIKQDYGSSKIILNVGRLSAQKNQKLLIDAFAKIAFKYPDWILKIIGEGELRAELERQIDRSSLGQRVMLSGSTDDIGKCYLEADIFAMSSDYESFGLALVEAMSHGLPVIGFADCQGVNELIDDRKNGLLIAPQDRVSNFSAGLETLISSVELRETLGREGIKTAQQYAPEVVADVWEKAILDACN